MRKTKLIKKDEFIGSLMRRDLGWLTDLPRDVVKRSYTAYGLNKYAKLFTKWRETDPDLRPLEDIVSINLKHNNNEDPCFISVIPRVPKSYGFDGVIISDARGDISAILPEGGPQKDILKSIYKETIHATNITKGGVIKVKGAIVSDTKLENGATDLSPENLTKNGRKCSLVMDNWEPVIGIGQMVDLPTGTIWNYSDITGEMFGLKDNKLVKYIKDKKKVEISFDTFLENSGIRGIYQRTDIGLLIKSVEGVVKEHKENDGTNQVNTGIDAMFSGADGAEKDNFRSECGEFFKCVEKQGISTEETLECISGLAEIFTKETKLSLDTKQAINDISPHSALTMLTFLGFEKVESKKDSKIKEIEGVDKWFDRILKDPDSQVAKKIGGVITNNERFTKYLKLLVYLLNSNPAYMNDSIRLPKQVYDYNTALGPKLPNGKLIRFNEEETKRARKFLQALHTSYKTGYFNTVSGKNPFTVTQRGLMYANSGIKFGDLQRFLPVGYSGHIMIGGLGEKRPTIFREIYELVLRCINSERKEITDESKKRVEESLDTIDKLDKNLRDTLETMTRFDSLVNDIDSTNETCLNSLRELNDFYTEHLNKKADEEVALLDNIKSILSVTEY